MPKFINKPPQAPEDIVLSPSDRGGLDYACKGYSKEDYDGMLKQWGKSLCLDVIRAFGDDLPTEGPDRQLFASVLHEAQNHHSASEKVKEPIIHGIESVLQERFKPYELREVGSSA